MIAALATRKVVVVVAEPDATMHVQTLASTVGLTVHVHILVVIVSAEPLGIRPPLLSKT